MSDPELDAKLKAYLEHQEAERARGYTLERLTDEVLSLGQRVNRLEHWRRELKDWWGRQHPTRRHDDMREPMPTLNPDDSIKVRAFGAEATFKGVVPVRIAMGVVLLAGVLALGYFAHGWISPRTASAMGSSK